MESLGLNDFHNPIFVRVLGSVRVFVTWRYGENVAWQELRSIEFVRFSRPHILNLSFTL